MGALLDDGPEAYDIIIVGAGVAGINCAYRLQSRLPDARFTVLEARDTLGGTWDLFTYPGVRSDSDLFTYGFAWEPWPYDTPIAEGALIMSYLRDCVAKHGLARYMNFGHRVVGADWSGAAKRWTLRVDASAAQHHGGGAAGRSPCVKRYEAAFLVLATGYYDYEAPLEAAIAGIETFAGRVVHPQFWPADYDFADKKVVVVGSGATAVTLIPNLAKTAARVTMLQRSPTWIAAAGNRVPLSGLARFLPRSVMAWLGWLWFFSVPFFQVMMARKLPRVAKKMLLAATRAQLPPEVSTDPHFTPRYDPWEQRVCLAPDGDFFQCLHGSDGQPARAAVVTAKIARVTEAGIVCEDGQRLEADVIVTATGLRMCWAGKIPLRVDGELVEPAEHAIWNGCMLDKVPNAVFMFGYAWAAWTLGVDNTAITLCRLWREMQKRDQQAIVPRLAVDKAVEQGDKEPWLALNSTYIKKARHSLPFNLKRGKGPWKARGNIWVDWMHARFGDIKQALDFS